MRLYNLEAENCPPTQWPRTFADLEPANLEMAVTCQRCGHEAVVDDTDVRLRNQCIAGRRYRCARCGAIAVALPAAAHAVDCNHAPFAATSARYNELANAMIGAGIKRPAVDKLMNSLCRAKYENSDAQRAALRLLKITDSTIDDPDYDTVAARGSGHDGADAQVRFPAPDHATTARCAGLGRQEPHSAPDESNSKCRSAFSNRSA